MNMQSIHHHSAAEQATTRFIQPLRSWAKEEKLFDCSISSESPKRSWTYFKYSVRDLPGLCFPCSGTYSAYSFTGSSITQIKRES